MPLGVISRVSFGFWGDLEKNTKRAKNGNRAPTPQRREPTLRGSPTP